MGCLMYCEATPNAKKSMRKMITMCLLAGALSVSAVSTGTPARQVAHKLTDLRSLITPAQRQKDALRLNAKPQKKAKKALGMRKEGVAPTTYKAVFESFFAEWEFCYAGGEFMTYDVDVTIDGTTATIKNLFNYANDEWASTVENELTGVYDPSAHTITIPTSKQLENATLIGYYYGTMPMVLLSGRVLPDQSMEHEKVLVFEVSEDEKTIRTQQDFAVMIYQESGSPYGYDKVYMGGVMKQSVAKPEMVCFVESLDFGNVFVGQTASSTVNVFNFGDDEALAEFTSTSPNFTVSAPSLGLDAMTAGVVDVNFTAAAEGGDDATLTLACDGVSSDIIMIGEGIAPIDYSYLVRGGNLNVTTGADFPFQKTTVDGKEVAKSNNLPVSGNTSYLSVSFDVPEGEMGVFKWKGFTNSTASWGGTPTVIVDGEEIYNYTEMYCKNLDEEVKFKAGHHTVIFQYLVRAATLYYDGDDYMWISDLELTTSPLQDNVFRVLTPEVKFANTIIEDTFVESNAVASFCNEGGNDITITELRGSDHFKGTVSGNSVISTLEKYQLPITFHAEAAGEYRETVTLVTSAGEYEVQCYAVVRNMPDYQQIVKGGDFKFSTTPAYPWLIKDGVAYNSTSKEVDTEVRFCTLSAEFEVPAGKVGLLSWGGRVSASESVENITDYLMITIQSTGKYQTTIVPGEFDLDTNFYPYFDAPDMADLTIPEGKGVISFSYVQFGDSKYYGDDIAEIKDLCLTLRDAEANAGLLQTETLEFPDTYEGKYAVLKARIYNLGTEPLRALNVTCADESFAGVPTEVAAPFQTTLEVPIYFMPTTSGDISADVLIETTAGDFLVSCTGKALSMDGILLLEDFESDIDWYAYDRDADGDCWDYAFNAFGGYTMGHTHSGTDCLVSFSRDNSGNFTPDNWAITPAFTIPAGANATLTWWSAADYGDPTPLGDIYGVYVSEGVPFGATGDTFTFGNYAELYREEQQSTEWAMHTVDLSAYAGKEVHLGFRHYDSEGKYMVKIDDVRVETNGGNGVSFVAEGDVASVEYYTLDGVAVSAPLQKGITVCKVVYVNGTASVIKIVK